ncbi:MAG: RusA family crossover junction endodeoxyribonuclease [Nocardioides sp.]
MTTLRFTIPGEPRGKARPRSTAKVVYVGANRQPEAIITVHSDPEMRRLETEILRLFRAAFPDHQPWTGPVMLRFTAVFPVPRSWPKKLQAAAQTGKLYHTSVPDKDNIEKLLVDALTPPQAKRGKDPVSPHGYAWVGDSQVQGGGVKRYGQMPRLEVELTPLAQPDMPATPGQKRREQALTATPTRRPTSPLQSTPTKSQSLGPEKQPPSLSGFTGRQRDLIEAALARDAVAQVERDKKAGR